MAAVCVTPRFAAMHPCERAGFIPVPQFDLFQKLFGSEKRSSPSINSNNPLAVELETENDRTLEDFCQLFQDISSVAAAAQATKTRIYSNDQHVERRGRAMCIAGDGYLRSRGAGIGTSADRCATQRHPIRMPFGL